MKGPVPRAALFRSPYFFTPASLMMNPQKPPRAAKSPAKGSLVTNLTPYFPAGSTLSTAMKSDLPGESSKSRSKVNFTSAEVISWPSWNFTPCRSLKFHVSPSGLTCHDSESSGITFMSGSKRTSWLYMRGERRLRESAGTSCGSRPVASVVWAEMKLPPGLGVCARARRPTDSAPRVRPPIWRSRRRLRPVSSERPRLVVMSCLREDVLLRVGVEDVAQAVSEQVESQHGDHDGDAGEDGDPGRGFQIGPPLVQHVAPGGRGRLGGEAEVAE